MSAQLRGIPQLLALSIVAMCGRALWADDVPFSNNQTADLSPVVMGASLPFAITLQTPTSFGDTLPTLQSFARAQINGEWLLVGGISQGQHFGSGNDGFVPAFQNTDVYVVDPVTQQVWHRSLLTDPTSGLSQAVVDSLSTSNTQFSQIGTQLYITGGYGHGYQSTNYLTYDTLTSINIPGLMSWVKNGVGTTAATNIRQIHDPMFEVTGGDMGTTANGLTHLIFGQDYPATYSGNRTGIYTDKVTSFRIVDNASGLSFTDVSTSDTSDDFRRRDLNVVPIIQKENGQPVGKYQALAGVFTPNFGAWTVPVTIGPDGSATEPDPQSAATFKQGMNSYRSANIGLYSAKTNTMHTLLLGGISYQYVDPITHSIQEDSNLPYINDSTDLVTDADGNMTQYLLPDLFPSMTSADGRPLYFGTETEFFLADGVQTFDNGVIDLDALSGPTLIGYLYGGIVSDAPNGGQTVASNLLFPVVINPAAVPEPSALSVMGAAVGILMMRKYRRR